ncbi:MAG: hypothetical protein AVO38_11965 [delta proteobacterium ML8_D]|nr:MAG: hypothetical protein AVO38_11965 [delta proteobacterium ML8_D]
MGGVSEHFAKIIELMGCNCFFAEYRGYGMSSGKPNLTTMLSDAEIIIRELDLPLEKIILYGRSFGTLSAIHLSQQFPNISGLVLESGIADLSKWGIYNEAPDRIGIDKDTLGKDINKYFNNKEKLSSFSGATLILHTLYDYLVHVSNANQLFEWAPHPKKKVIFEHGNHSDIYISNLLEFTGEVKKFIKKL